MSNKKLTLELEPSRISELVLTPPKPMQIELPTTTGQRAKAYVDTTAHWSQKTSYIPPKGEIIVYSDHSVIEGVNYPAIKIGDGMAYVVDLPFVGDDITAQITAMIDDHISNINIHVTAADKEFWSNKLNYEIDPLDNETLVFNRL